MPQSTEAVVVGGGTLYVADRGEPFPVMPSETPGGNWDALSLTIDGAVLGRSLTTEQVFVDEYLDAIIENETEVTSSLSMTLAQFTFDVLERALNGGTTEVEPNGATRYTPPNAGESVGFAGLYVYADEYGAPAQIEMPNIKNVADLSVPFRKRGGNPRQVPVEFRILATDTHPAGWSILAAPAPGSSV